jgi:hypothetical protein
MIIDALPRPHGGDGHARAIWPLVPKHYLRAGAMIARAIGASHITSVVVVCHASTIDLLRAVFYLMKSSNPISCSLPPRTYDRE